MARPVTHYCRYVLLQLNKSVCHLKHLFSVIFHIEMANFLMVEIKTHESLLLAVVVFRAACVTGNTERKNLLQSFRQGLLW